MFDLPVTEGIGDRGLVRRYCNFAYSALACFRMGMSGSASFQSAGPRSRAVVRGPIAVPWLRSVRDADALHQSVEPRVSSQAVV